MAGRLRNRRLLVPPGGLVRPTPERVREAVFDVLGARVDGARVLDAFSGSGALGLEALSRGAREVVFLERRPDIAAVLGRNVDGLGVRGQTQLIVRDAIQALRLGVVRGPFELVLVDPPFDAGLARPFLEALAAGDYVSRDGVIVVERSSRERTPEGVRGLPIVQSRRYGDVSVDFYRAEDDP